MNKTNSWPPADRTHIAVHVHDPWRDFPGAVLLKYWLEAEYGYRVSLVSTHVGRPSLHYWEWLDRVRPDAVVFPKIHDPPRFFERYAGSIRNRYRPSVFVLSTESMRKTGDERPGTKAIEPIDLVLAWNREQASLLESLFGLKEEQIAVTGNPRFDWYDDRLRTSWDDRPSVLKLLGVSPSWGGTIVTVSGTFPMADRRDGKNLALKIRQAEEFGLGDIRQMQAEAEDAWQRREAFFDLVIRASEEFQGVQFLVKPHPMERIDRYRAVLDGRERIGIVEREYPFIFLGASDLHIHHGCTTALEAWLLGVPAVDYAPTKVSQKAQHWRARGSIRTENEEQVLEVIRRVVAGETNLLEALEDERRDHARILFSDMVGISGQACARAIHEHLTGNPKYRGPRTFSLRGALYERWSVDTFRSAGESPLRYLQRLVSHLPYQSASMIFQLARGQATPPDTVGRFLSHTETKKWTKLIAKSGLNVSKSAPMEEA